MGSQTNKTIPKTMKFLGVFLLIGYTTANHRRGQNQGQQDFDQLANQARQQAINSGIRRNHINAANNKVEACYEEVLRKAQIAARKNGLKGNNGRVLNVKNQVRLFTTQLGSSDEYKHLKAQSQEFAKKQLKEYENEQRQAKNIKVNAALIKFQGLLANYVNQIENEELSKAANQLAAEAVKQSKDFLGQGNKNLMAVLQGKMRGAIKSQLCGEKKRCTIKSGANTRI